MFINNKLKEMKEFQGKCPISLMLDIEGTKYEWHDQYITGSQVKNLGHIPANEDLYLTIEGRGRTNLLRIPLLLT